MAVPESLRWLFWELETDELDLERHAAYVIARILERGRMEDVDWVLATYGEARVHGFFRDVGHPELSPRTLSFWRAYFQAKDERWADTAAWRRSSSVPWIS